MQAGALLRQRDRLRADADSSGEGESGGVEGEFGVFQEARDVLRETQDRQAEEAEADASFGAGGGHDVPLPSLAEGAAPAALLASRLSESARETLRFAVALGGEVPHQAHSAGAGRETPTRTLLSASSWAARWSPRSAGATGSPPACRPSWRPPDTRDGAGERAVTVARHYAWWAGHPSVTSGRVAAEADAVLAALTAAVPLTSPGGGEESAAVQLARQAAPAFAAGLDWGAWERVLRSGVEAARLAGVVGEQAYFHHELGIFALCSGQLDRARAELEASIGLRGALADKRGTVAGRRALALVADRSGATSPGGRTAAGEEVPDARHEESASPPGGVPPGSGFGSGFGPPRLSGDTSKGGTLPPDLDSAGAAGTGGITGSGAGPAHKRGGIKNRLVSGARRNLVAVGAGALLAAVLGTVVTLGATSDGKSDAPSEKIGVNPSTSPGANDDGLGAERTKPGSDDTPGTVPPPTNPGPDGRYGTPDDPTPSGSPSDDLSGTDKPDEPDKPGKPDTPDKPTKSPSKPPSKPPTGTPNPPSSPPPTSTSPSTPPPTAPPSETPSTTNSASEPAASQPVETSTSESAPDGDEPGSPSGSMSGPMSDSSVI